MWINRWVYLHHMFINTYIKFKYDDIFFSHYLCNNFISDRRPQLFCLYVRLLLLVARGLVG